jgi:hypothetical protein
MYIKYFLVLCLRHVVSCVPNVVSVSGLSILHFLIAPSVLANMSTPSSLKKPTAMQSFELFKKQAKQKEERVRFQSLFVSTIEFRWLELKGTVKICLSYWKFVMWCLVYPMLSVSLDCPFFISWLPHRFSLTFIQSYTTCSNHIHMENMWCCLHRNCLLYTTIKYWNFRRKSWER